MGFLLLKKDFLQKSASPGWERHSECRKTSFKSKTVPKRERKVFARLFQKAADSKGRAFGCFPQKAEPNLFAPRARTKRKKRSHELMYQFMTCRPAADDPAPSFCLQNDGLEFPKFLSTAHLRQQITPLCAICQTMLSFLTGGVPLLNGRGTPCF